MALDGYAERQPSFAGLHKLYHPVPLPRATPDSIYKEVKASLRRIPIQDNERLGALAHTRPALEVHAPAFFRHAIYFFPHNSKERDPLLHPGSFERREAIKNITVLIGRFAPNKRAEIEKELLERFEKDESCIIDLGTFLDFDLRAVVDVYTEYATMTLILDNNAPLVSGPNVSSPIALAGWIRGKANVRKLQMPLREYTSAFEAEYTDSEAVFFGIWELLNDARQVRLSQSDVGKMVGDFRGIAIWPTGCDVANIKQTAYAGSVDTKTPIPPSNRADAKKYHFSPTNTRVPREQNVMQFLEEERDFFLGCLGLDGRGGLLYEKAPKKRLEPNIILCRMMDGDVVYGSALGNPLTYRNRRVPIPGAPAPITYFVIHNGTSANQLGRMIRRQNLMGELRLAALLDAETIMKLGSSIRRLSGLVSHLISHGTRLSAVSQREFRDALELYTEIGRKCHGGLPYRMARATYYYDALQTHLSDIRSHPIQGWQSYPGFIRRHFDQRFRSMRSTGQRYIDVGTRVERLYALYGLERQRLVGLPSIVFGTLSFASAAAAATFTYLYPSAPSLAYLIAGTVFTFVCLANGYFVWILSRKRSVQRMIDNASRRSIWTLTTALMISASAFLIALLVLSWAEVDFARRAFDFLKGLFRPMSL